MKNHYGLDLASLMSVASFYEKTGEGNKRNKKGVLREAVLAL
jgi:hypothetical protein